MAVGMVLIIFVVLLVLVIGGGFLAAAIANKKDNNRMLARVRTQQLSIAEGALRRIANGAGLPSEEASLALDEISNHYQRELNS